jgi:hypothetical protein
LLIKCADISNVICYLWHRVPSTANGMYALGINAKWSDILQLEFSEQGEMETEVREQEVFGTVMGMVALDWAYGRSGMRVRCGEENKVSRL